MRKKRSATPLVSGSAGKCVVRRQAPEADLVLEVVGHEGAAVIIVQHGALRDADAICKAVARPSMQFVPVKSAEKQAVLVLHRARELLIRQRIMLVDALRAHLAK